MSPDPLRAGWVWRRDWLYISPVPRPSLVPGAEEKRLVHTEALPLIKNGVAHVCDVYTV